eukprot:12422179-Prorocentrum_lima.AAC.1
MGTDFALGHSSLRWSHADLLCKVQRECHHCAGVMLIFSVSYRDSAIFVLGQRPQATYHPTNYYLLATNY